MAEFKITVLRFPQNATWVSCLLTVLQEDLPAFFGPHPIALVFSPSASFFFFFFHFALYRIKQGPWGKDVSNLFLIIISWSLETILFTFQCKFILNILLVTNASSNGWLTWPHSLLAKISLRERVTNKASGERIRENKRRGSCMLFTISS